MLIQCTKKLLDELKITPAVSEEEYNPLFSWHANLLTINRRKTVVLMNDSNRYVIVLYGLKAKDFKNLNTLIVNAIRENLLLECINPDIIDKFVPTDTEINYSKTRNRTTVARLNKSCEAAEFSFEDFNGNVINQTIAGMNASRSIVGDGSGEYIKPHVKMFENLEQLAGSPVFKCKAVQIKATMDLGNFEVWRRLVIPINYTFKQLHSILQVAFGWQNCHLHDFDVMDGDKPIINLVCSDDAFEYPRDIPMKLETEYRLFDFFPEYKKISYTYDFGDFWKHDLEIEEIIPDYSNNYAVCIEGVGNTPPEDVGGEGGYEMFLEAISDLAHEEHELNVEWGKSQGYTDFNIDEVNKELKIKMNRFF